MDTKPNLEEDLHASDKIRQRVSESEIYAQNLYAAMCNVSWRKSEIFEILKGSHWSISWRGAGRVVSELRGKGDYMDWYCSGLVQGYDDERINGYVGEGTVVDVIRADLREIGWFPVSEDTNPEV